MNARLTSLPFRRGLRKLYHEAAEPKNGRPTADTLDRTVTSEPRLMPVACNGRLGGAGTTLAC
jgi:hypothetical protein